jgi:hypothetical protein
LGIWGETHEDWIAQIVAMSRAISIWDLLRVEDRAGLGLFIRWYDAEDDGTQKQFAAWMYDSHPDVPRWPPVPLRLEPTAGPTLTCFAH